MSNMDDNPNKFTLVWKILNFNSPMLLRKDLFLSPVFVTEYSEKLEWYICFENLDDLCQFRLIPCGDAENDTPFYYNWNVTIMCNDGENDTSMDMRHEVSRWNISTAIFNFDCYYMLINEKKYLNEGRLTLLFSMWKDSGDAFYMNRMITDTTHFEDSSLKYHVYSFVWDISDFGKETVVEKKIFMDEYEFLFKTSISGENDVEVTVRNIGRVKSNFNVCSQVVFSHSKLPNKVLEIQYRKSSRDVKVFHFPDFSKKNKLKAIKSNFLHKGVLSLYFNVAVTWFDSKISYVTYDFRPPTKTIMKGISGKCVAM